jgi:hypothetical protein
VQAFEAGETAVEVVQTLFGLADLLVGETVACGLS